MQTKYALGLDFGTNSVRALVADVATGEEVADAVWDYEHGEAGVVLDARDPDVARQRPADYVKGLAQCVRTALRKAAACPGFTPAQIVGIGLDATGSTPIPVDTAGRPLAFDGAFADDLAALAWLWKDHTSHAEAEEITAAAAGLRPHYLAKCGGAYSAEWFWAKALHCRRTAPDIFEAAHTWVECPDWLGGLLTGTSDPRVLKRGICAAGHKAMFNPAWGGYPDEEFLSELDDGLGRLRRSLPERAYTIADRAGALAEPWAERLGLPAGLPVAIGAIDAHMGAVGCGIAPRVLVRIMGTSACDMMVAPLDQPLADVPGLCGIVPESILPGCYGLEAGQSAVGDIYNWFVNTVRPGGDSGGSHEALAAAAGRLKPGESGLLGLDWHNGNRTVLADQRLTGLLIGLTLRSTPAEIYRAFIEATAFGARVILERFEEYGLGVERVVACGGIAVKSPLAMQIHADVLDRTIEVARSDQTCALGAAMAGAVAARSEAGGHDDYGQAAAAMAGVRAESYRPAPARARVYARLHSLYRRLHDVYGTEACRDNLADVMKGLLAIRDQARS